MSSLAAFANLDVDKLIADIAERPAIWDRNFNGRQNKGYLEEVWQELAEAHNAPSKRNITIVLYWEVSLKLILSLVVT
jgi:hypothetical protein